MKTWPEDPEKVELFLSDCDWENAKRFFRLYGKTVRYNNILGWYTWDGQTWTRDYSQGLNYGVKVCELIFLTSSVLLHLPPEVSSYAQEYSRASNPVGIKAMLETAEYRMQISVEELEPLTPADELRLETYLRNYEDQDPD